MLDGLGMSSELANAIANVQQALAERAAPLVDALDEKGRLPEWRTLLKPA
jgi:hypothetical protein